MKLKIIAELAQGFEGNYKQAELLIKAASSSGADAAKFHLIYADELATTDYVHYKLFKGLEMKDEEWELLNDFATKNNIELNLEVLGIQGLKLCEKIGIKSIKLHPTDISNYGLLSKISKSNIDNIYLGAGGAHLDEIEKALTILNNKVVTILLGFQSYPTPNEDNQIHRVNLLKEILNLKFNNVNIGFADHADPDSKVSFALGSIAIGAGATVLEKHLTLGKNMQIEDYESALNPDEFANFVATMKASFDAFGSSLSSNDFKMSNSEKKYRKMTRRHVVSFRKIRKGTVLTHSDLILKRTSSAYFIHDLGSVYGKELLVDVDKDQPILKKMFK